MRVAGPRYMADTMDITLQAETAFNQGNMTRARFDNICQAAGLHPNRHGLLACRELRPFFSITEVARYDWCHTFLQDGVLTTEIWLILETMEKGKHCDFPTLCNYFKGSLLGSIMRARCFPMRFVMCS